MDRTLSADFGDFLARLALVWAGVTELIRDFLMYSLTVFFFSEKITFFLFDLASVLVDPRFFLDTLGVKKLPVFFVASGVDTGVMGPVAAVVGAESAVVSIANLGFFSLRFFFPSCLWTSSVFLTCVVWVCLSVQWCPHPQSSPTQYPLEFPQK